jgi:hypothetical protein
MISVRDLRVGNLFQFPINGKIEYWDICDIHTNPFEVYFTQNDQYDYSTHLDDLVIPITGAILLSFGFEYIVDAILSECHYVKGKFILNDEYVLCDIDIEVKYVHQLQNLYYVLCGEELEIKLMLWK